MKAIADFDRYHESENKRDSVLYISTYSGYAPGCSKYGRISYMYPGSNDISTLYILIQID